MRTVKCSAFVLTLFILALPLGCAQKDEAGKAKEYVSESDQYYQRAVAAYTQLIAKGKDVERLRFALGKLYFDRGEFAQAIEEFKKTKSQESQKFLAIAYYRIGNFTDALEIFNTRQIPDDEYLYYQGLTCEKLNLFDQALAVYRKINDVPLAKKAGERIGLIEKQENALTLKESDPAVNAILTSAPSAGEYPEAGALVLCCDERIEIRKEGTEVSYVHYIIKILNERGKQDFSETHIEYDSTFERVELVSARTIKPDGSIVDVGTRHIRDVSKYLNFPLYSNARVYIISFPEIVEGAAIEYTLKVYNNQLINKKDFVLAYTAQAHEPIISARFDISCPKERPLHLKTLNNAYNTFGAQLTPVTKEEAGRLLYHWEFKNIPQIIPEPNMPPDAEINPTLLISTFASWKEIYDWWWQQACDKIKADAAITQKVRELIKDKASQEEKLRAVYNYCSQRIRYVAVEYGKAGFEPHGAGDIFKNKYGDCKDKAILLITMLKEAGITAYPVLIATKDYYTAHEDFPTVLFNHCIAVVPSKDTMTFLDPTAETCAFGDLPPDDQNRKVFVCKSDGFTLYDTPLYPASHNLITQRLALKVNSDETITANKTNSSFGMYDQAQRYWLLYTQPELIKQMLKEKIQEVSIGAELNNYAIDNLEKLDVPVVVRYDFKGKEYFTSAGNLRIMPQLASLDTSLVAKDTRTYAIDFNALDLKRALFEIELPSDLVIKYIPESVHEQSPWLKLSVEYTRKDHTLTFLQETELVKSAIPESEYPEFKKYYEKLAQKIKQRIVLEKIK